MPDHTTLFPPFDPLQINPVQFSASGNLSRTPCFSLFLIQSGEGTVQISHATHSFHAPTLLCLSPYQCAAFTHNSQIEGLLLRFHANFFCIETHHHAVGCNGVLFNDVYEVPLVNLEPAQLVEFTDLFQAIGKELQQAALAQLEILTSYLKVLLVKATRLKIAQHGQDGLEATKQPDILRQLRDALEEHYQQKHRPSDYAAMLGVSHKTLSGLVKLHFHQTLSELIRERVLKHARWQLLHTLKSVKEIAYEVGFEDEFYFSRLFKRSFGCSPTAFREYETALRGSSNISM